MPSSKPKFKAIYAKKPSEKLQEFIGKTITTMEGIPVVVETITGSVFKPTRFEINGKHHVVILDAYKQLNKDRSITQAMIDDFDQCVVEHIEKIGPKDKVGAMQQAPKFGSKE